MAGAVADVAARTVAGRRRAFGFYRWQRGLLCCSAPVINELSMVGTGLGTRFQYREEAEQEIAGHVARLTCVGSSSAALDLCMVATGQRTPYWLRYKLLGLRSGALFAEGGGPHVVVNAEAGSAGLARR